jgi:GntR family transcriptional regulator
MTTDLDPSGREPPVSRRIADDLRRKIETGELTPGARLPSERELAARYRVARNTAREAARLLAEEGLVVAEHGRGVFVRPAKPLVRFGNDRYSPQHRATGLSPFLLECARQGRTPRIEVLAIARVLPPEGVAERLQVSPRTKSVVQRENLFYADQDPVHRVTTWIPWAIAQGTSLTKPDVGHPYGIHGILEDKGHGMARIREEITSRMPRLAEAHDLKAGPGTTVLDVLHTSFDAAGTPYELTRFVMRGDLTGLVYDIPVE